MSLSRADYKTLGACLFVVSLVTVLAVRRGSNMSLWIPLMPGCVVAQLATGLFKASFTNIYCIGLEIISNTLVYSGLILLFSRIPQKR